MEQSQLEELQVECDELRAQVRALATAKPEDAPNAPPHHSPPWLAAKLAQSQRQVALLSDAMVARANLSIELEAVLLQLASPAADGSVAPAAQWAGSALRRIRHVQHAESIARSLAPDEPPPPRVAPPRRKPLAKPSAAATRPSASAARPTTGAKSAQPHGAQKARPAVR